MLVRKIKEARKTIYTLKLVESIEYVEDAMIDQGRDFFPFGLYDYCCYQPDSIREVLTGLKNERKRLIIKLMTVNPRLCRKLYPNEKEREIELDEVIEKACEATKNRG